MRPEKIISGGQTGSDRAGIDAARELGIQTGGFAPKGWKICLPDGTDGSDPSLADYGLVECASSEYPPRTRLNVQHSDGTAIFGYLKSPGARLTIRTAEDQGKPLIKNPSPKMLREWVEKHQIKVLNVAGNRASDQNPGVYETVKSVIVEAFQGEGDRDS